MSDLSETIGEIATGLEQFKAEQRSKLDQMETRMMRPGANLMGTSNQALPTETERKAFGEMLRTGNRQLAVEAKASVNVSNAGQGLEAVADWFDSEVLSVAREITPLLKLVRIKTVSNFPAKHIVTNAYAMGSGWIDELGSRVDTDAPKANVVEVTAGEWYALPAASEWALTDVSFDVESWLKSELVAEYSESLQAAIVAGNGTSKPTGFLAGPTPVTTADGARAFGTLQYYPTGAASTLPATAIAAVDLFTDVTLGLAWKHRQNACWVMSSSTIAAVRKFKDADNRPLFVDSLIAGQPKTLMGYPVYECEAMPPIGAGTFPIAFGDFNQGYILDQDSQSMKITRDEYTTKGLVKYYARRRIGGKILDSDAIKLIKVSAT